MEAYIIIKYLEYLINRIWRIKTKPTEREQTKQQVQRQQAQQERDDNWRPTRLDQLLLGIFIKYFNILY